MSYKRSRDSFESDAPAHQRPPFALFGTPLPPLDSEARDDGSYVPLWKQEVRDERGRKRLHGAFTGGFSAGYFNTVGSREGWTPSAFVSSRARKDGQTSNARRAEDFMDEEDLADAAEAQKLETQGGFAGLGATEGDANRRGFLTDLFKTSGDTMGVKLLQRMGWRQGQGVGPKVRRKVRDEDGQEESEMHLFAPDDSPMVSFNRKTDRFGLGYGGGERLRAARSSSRPAAEVDDEEQDDVEDVFRVKRSAKAKIKPKKTGFGVGILNDTGSDDEDPYEIGPKIAYNRIIGGDKKKRKGGLIANTATPPTKSKLQPVFLSRKLTQRATSSGFRKCFDGRLPLDGFLLATAPLLNDQENKYPPPAIPEGWQSSKVDASMPTDAKTFQSTADAARASSMDPARRAAMLGEAQLPGKSIFDFISPAQRDKLAAASGRANLPAGRGEAAPAGFATSDADKARSLWDLVPRLDHATATAALQRGIAGWMPYAEDESKRRRYRTFLESMAGTRQDLPERSKGATNDEWVVEMCEFAQAAQVFKPMSGLMASRFTTSSAAPKLASDAPEPAETKSGRQEDPAEAAAKIGMFGPMTRSRDQFFPTRLTCKRFNVKPPAHVLTDPGGGAAGASAGQDSRTDILGKATMEQMMREASRKSSNATKTEDVTTSGETLEVVIPSKTEEVDVEQNEALEGERPGDAVFRAIFGSDDEDG